MAVRFYDEAITEKIKNWTKQTDIKVLRPDETTRLFEMLADEKKDQPLHLPLITLSRDRDIQILNMEKQPKTFNGYKVHSNENGTILLNIIPISLSYQLDIYTAKMEEADEWVRNFIFNFINYPKVTIEIPYNDINIKHDSNILLDATITDNSDIKERLFPDQFYRFTIKFMIDDAYIFSAPLKENVQLEVTGIDLADSNNPGIIEKEDL